MTDMERLLELNALRASNFDPEISPNQHRYYVELNEFYKDKNCTTLEEATEILQGTKFIKGLTEDFLLDDVGARIKAMEEAGYEDAAAVYRERRDKIKTVGYDYAYSQEAIDGFTKANEICAAYNRRKEIIGRMFTAYFNIVGGTEKIHREGNVKIIKDGLKELKDDGLDFYELAKQPAYRKLTMTTEKGTENFIAFVRKIEAGGEAEVLSVKNLAEEQNRVSDFVKKNMDLMRQLREQETWKRGVSVAVPSDAPYGYDFIDTKEVDYRWRI